MWGSIINSLLAGHIHMLSRVVDRKKKTWKAYLKRRRFRGWTEPENIIRNSKRSAFSSRVSCWDSYKFVSINVDLNWKGCLPNLVEGSRRWLLTSVGMFASPLTPKHFSCETIFARFHWPSMNECKWEARCQKASRSHQTQVLIWKTGTTKKTIV